VVAQMERHGIKVDRERLAHLSTGVRCRDRRARSEIFALTGQEFTIGSPKQLGDILFDKLGYKGGSKGKSGQYSTDQASSKALPRKGRSRHARCSTGGSSPSCARPTPRRCRPRSIRIPGASTPATLVGAQTGRLSSTEPNLQNIPIRTEIGRQIRECFVAEPGNLLLAADYSQIELRLAAHMCDVPTLKEAFAAGEDIHARTASEMFGHVDRDTRARAKTINFAILYGISRWGLAGRLGVDGGRGAGDDRPLFRALPRHPALYRHDAGNGARLRLFADAVRPQDVVPADQFEEPGRTAGQRARGDQRADPGHQRRHHQAGDGADDARAGRGGP
jgi:DNA polymerase-1